MGMGLGKDMGKYISIIFILGLGMGLGKDMGKFIRTHKHIFNFWSRPNQILIFD